MKFMLKGNHDELMGVLDQISEVADKEGDDITKTTKGKILKRVSQISIIPFDMDSINTDFSLVYFKEGNDVLLNIPTYVPKSFRVGGIMKRKMVRSLKEIFDASKVDVNIKFLSWE